MGVLREDENILPPLLAVHESTVPALGVFKDEVVPILRDAGVAARDAIVENHEVAVTLPPDAEWKLRYGDFPVGARRVAND